MASPVRTTIEGTEYAFPILTPAQRIALADRFDDEDRARLVKDLHDAGVEPSVKFEELRKFDLTRGDITRTVRRLFKVDGAIRALEVAAAGMEAKPAIDRMDPYEACNLALQLCNFKLEPKGGEAPAAADEDDVNPTK